MKNIKDEVTQPSMIVLLLVKCKIENQTIELQRPNYFGGSFELGVKPQMRIMVNFREVTKKVTPSISLWSSSVLIRAYFQKRHNASQNEWLQSTARRNS